MSLPSVITPRRLAVASTFALALTLGACASPRDQRMLDGALIGGAGGAAVGAIATGTGGGAVVGGVAGAAAGAVIADATRPRHARGKTCWWSDTLHRRVCRWR
ncbi:glycine zipper domain-containing protein [Pinisolibacter aquiterrae]|uniref:glycine zipper domain-containing protein n=1 Tax=Pinisolibacter aquiterrae TaxID=2815579 RepID=UPI001E6064A4|nr:hypothetical protein [Pinisolibacter aquiterrae]MCC8237305.1 hypothetical protein [Pinisolibacter aquiterrae]